MVFKRNTLRNTRTFKQSTSINSSNVKITQSKPVSYKKPTRYVNKIYNQNKDWSVNSTIKSILDPVPEADAYESYDPNAGYADGKFQAPDGETYVSEGNAKFYPKEGETPYNPYGQHEKTKDMESKYTTTFGEHLDKVGPLGVVKGAIEELTGNPHLFTSYDDPFHPNNYKKMGASGAQEEDPNNQFWLDQKNQQGQGQEQGQEQNNTDSEFKFRDSLPISEIPVNPKLVNPVKDATGFGVVDYIGNNVQTQYYKLGSEVSKDQHLGALNKQSLYKFENLVQSNFSTLVSNPNALNENSFKEIKNLINNSNIPNTDKKRLLEEYKKKKIKYQKTQGNKTSTPWVFDTSSGIKPNEAESLSLKIADGTITKKELNKWKVFTGQDLPKGVTKPDGSMPKILTYKDLF